MMFITRPAKSPPAITLPVLIWDMASPPSGGSMLMLSPVGKALCVSADLIVLLNLVLSEQRASLEMSSQVNEPQLAL